MSSITENPNLLLKSMVPSGWRTILLSTWRCQAPPEGVEWRQKTGVRTYPPECERYLSVGGKVKIDDIATEKQVNNGAQTEKGSKGQSESAVNPFGQHEAHANHRAAQ